MLSLTPCSYARIYGYQFSKDDHLKLVRLMYELVTIPNLESPLVHTWAGMLGRLLQYVCVCCVCTHVCIHVWLETLQLCIVYECCSMINTPCTSAFRHTSLNPSGGILQFLETYLLKTDLCFLSTVAKRALCTLWHCYAILLSELWPSSKGMNIYTCGCVSGNCGC